MTKKSLKTMLAEFGEITAWFEGEDIEIEEATKKYEEGAKLAAEIKDQLEKSKNRIEVLNTKFDE